MRRLITGLILILMTATVAFAQAADAKAKAEAILKQARAAIGDEKKLKDLQALSATGNVRQTFGDRQMESEIQIDLMMPDKIMRTSNSQRGTNINTLNGDQLWNDFIPAMGAGGGGFGPGGGGGGRVMIFGGGPGGPAGPGGADNPMVKYFQMGQRRDLVLVMLGWLLTAPASAQMEYTYGGEAPGPGGSKLDAIIAKSAAGYNSVLYFDQEKHQLIGIKYKVKQMRGMGGGRGAFVGAGGPGGQRQGDGVQRQGGDGQRQGGDGQRQGGDGQRQGGGRGNAQGGQGNAPGGQPGQPGQRPELSPEERERFAKEMQERFEKAPEVDFSWGFSDYK